ncbi:cysteine desulfurase family protein [Thermosulfuriphilus sp.]
MEIYLDYNATCPVAEEVLEAMEPYFRHHFGNPSSGHRLGQAAREALEEARRRLARVIGASPEEIIFLSGGTEANNAAVFGSLAAQPDKRHLITSQIEHSSVLNPCLRLLERGFDVTFVPVDSTGLVDPDDIRRAIRKDTGLISIMQANNEVGTIEPVAEIGRLAREADVAFHVDAAQALGKVSVWVEELFCDYLTLAGHKFYAPKGIGALYIRKGAPFSPILSGAGQEGGRRPGTEPVALAVGLARAAELATEDLPQEGRRMETLRDRLYEGLKALWPGLILNGHPEQRLPNTLNVSFLGLEAARLLTKTPQVMVSTGAACHDRSGSVSHVLAAMGKGPDVARGTIRFSLGRMTTEEEIKATISLFEEVLRAG